MPVTCCSLPIRVEDRWQANLHRADYLRNVFRLRIGMAVSVGIPRFAWMTPQLEHNHFSEFYHLQPDVVGIRLFLTGNT